MTNATTSRTYKGHTIYPCCWATGEHRGKWIVQTYHLTGMPYADELCPHFATLAAARERITDMVYEESFEAEHNAMVAAADAAPR